MHSQRSTFPTKRARAKIVSRHEHPGRRRQGHARPQGRNVVLERSFGAPTVTKDGVSVAKEIELKDKFENMGAQMVKESRPKLAESPRPWWRAQPTAPSSTEKLSAGPW